jgi:hypothetical protein
LGFCCSIPRKFTRKKTQAPDLIPRKKIRPTPPTTTEPEEEAAENKEEVAGPISSVGPTAPTEEAQQPMGTTTGMTTTTRGKRKGDLKRGRKKKGKGGRTKRKRKEKAIKNKEEEEEEEEEEEADQDKTKEDETSEEEGPSKPTALL